MISVSKVFPLKFATVTFTFTHLNKPINCTPLIFTHLLIYVFLIFRNLRISFRSGILHQICSYTKRYPVKIHFYYFRVGKYCCFGFFNFIQKLLLIVEHSFRTKALVPLIVVRELDPFNFCAGQMRKNQWGSKINVNWVYSTKSNDVSQD